MSRAPLAVVALLAMLACAIGQQDTLLGMLAALGGALALTRRSAPGAMLLAALAVRMVLPDPPWPELPPLRDVIAARVLRALPEPDGSIAVGSLLGGRRLLPPEVFQAFVTTGTSHLLAVSGFHITITAGGLALMLRPFGARAAAAATVVAAVGMALIVGMHASVTRAAIMACVATLGILLGRPAGGLNALAAAATFLLIAAPGAIADVGFRLSVSATAGLVLWARALERRLIGPAWLRGHVAASISASLASLPVLALIFGRVPVLSPLVNVLVAPLMPPLMSATGIALFVSWVAEPLALPAAWSAYLIARVLRATVEAFAGLPIATLEVDPPLVMVALAIGGAGLAVRLRGRLAELRPAAPPRRAAAAACAFAVLVAFGAPLASGSSAPRVLALDVGQGDAFLVEAGGERVLIDGGPDPRRVLRALGDVLPFWERRIDAVILTHGHDDHSTGLGAVLERYDVGIAVEPAGMPGDPIVDAWRQAVARAGVPLRTLGRGDRLRVGALVFDVLAPLPGSADPLPNLVLRAQVGPMTALFPGDVTERGQADLLLYPQELRAEIYAPPHHGAATRYAEELVAAVRPSVAVLSVGVGNRYGHPAPQTLRALEGLRVMRTDRDGTLEISWDGDSIACRVRASALSRAWSGWISRPPPCASPGAGPDER